MTETLQTPVRELTTGSTFAGRYQIIEELGRGGMGRVYKAFDAKIKEKVALKLIKPEVASDKETIERFGNELRLARNISQRNVCRMFDMGEAEGAHFITMEYVHGEDLKSMIHMSGSLSVGMLLSVGKQVCDGLAEAHNLGVVHRDLKPQNIMIDKNGNAKIMDFGIARSVREKGITGPSVMIGTPEYMSPEQAEAKEVDHRSDIYSLGIVLYEMATSHVPFEGETALSIAMKHKGETPKDPRSLNPNVPVDLSGVILKCLEKDKTKRYQSASDVHSELEKIEKGIPTAERIQPKTRATTTRGATVTLKRRWIFMTSALILALLAAFTFLIWRGIKVKKGAVSDHNKVLVVLPFENLGPIEDEYFADGITDEITNSLSTLYGLGVISRNSAGQYKKTTKTIKQIREELNVDYVLSGTVRWEKESGQRGRVRVTPHLIRTEDDTQIWSSTYEQAVEDIFGIQTRIAENVTKQLDLTILEPERRMLEARPTNNPEAYDCFLRANSLAAVDISSIQECELAIGLYEKAVRLDPKFVQAYIGLSVFHSAVYHAGIDRTEARLAKSKAAADRALELAPDLPEGKKALAYYYYWGYLDYDRALEILESVRRARPNNPPTLIGFIQRRKGKWTDALSILEAVFKLNPRDSDAASEIALTNMSLRKYEDAEAWEDRSLSLNPQYIQAKADKARSFYHRKETTEEARALVKALTPGPWSDYLGVLLEMADRDWKSVMDKLDSISLDSYDVFSLCYFNKNLAYALAFFAQEDISNTRRYADLARAALERSVNKNPVDPRYHSSLGLAYAYLGRKDEAIREGNQAVNLYPVSKDALNGPSFVVNLAQIFVITGEYGKALEKIEYLMSIPAGYYISVGSLRKDPAWDPLRDQPRFRQLIEKHSLD
jgi:serine/threonine protein kinase/tetratricopeptide (TPR) repeat protein